MIKQIFRTFPLFVTALALSAHAQFSKLHVGSVSVGGTGQFSTALTSNPTNTSYTYPVTPGNFTTTTVMNKQQFTTNSAGFVAKMQLQPLPWAGLELNYGFTRYSERYSYNTANNATTATVKVPTYWHEATGAYMLHPKHIPFQPYVGIGGGAIDFAIRDNQWRGAGLLEAGFDVPVKHTHMGFRVGARSLYYRAPNFNTTLISTRSWRVTTEPEISTYYRF